MVWIQIFAAVVTIAGTAFGLTLAILDETYDWRERRRFKRLQAQGKTFNG